MKNVLKRYQATIPIFLVGIAFVLTILFRYKNSELAIVAATLLFLALVVRVLYSELYLNRLSVQSKRFASLLNVHDGQAFEKLQLACCLIDDFGQIVWVNPTFLSSFSIKKSALSMNILDLLEMNDLDSLKRGEGFKIQFQKKHFSVNSSEIDLSQNQKNYLLYFLDESELIDLKKEFDDTRPVAMLTLLDNSDDMYSKFKESECAAIFSMIEQEIDNWASSYGAICRKYSNSRTLIIAEERTLEKMRKDKFSILESIRSMKYNSKAVDVTLSVGVGICGNVQEVYDYARQALDMSQSRGGDQVAIKDSQQFSFFGGTSEGKEQSNKIKTRFIAKSITELILSSERVLVMGHRYSDFDAFGSSAGIFCLCKHLGVPANIVVNQDTTLASPMVEQFVESFGHNVVISPKQALAIVSDTTLVVVCDTHKQDFTECPQLLDSCGSVMVIDHHRKSVGFIENAVVFYHRPNSSSASEMVSEILQYVDGGTFLDSITAQALLSGIMLDTRNYVIRCGVRTFEAAAYLKQRSANTVAAKKLFSSDMNLFRQRNILIDNASKYRGCCAVSIADFEDRDIRLITSQAADEMLNIEGVRSSFVLYKNKDTINISARSYGEMNVQLIMEYLGGGGHQSMSACQISGVDFKEALNLLYEAIDKYLEENQEKNYESYIESGR